MTTKAQILKVIRENCINCVVGAVSVIPDCGGQGTRTLFPYRLGKIRTRPGGATPTPS